MAARHPFEILASFKPKRGALHLGNFASLADTLDGIFRQDVPDELRDVVATITLLRVATLQRFGAYTKDPRDQIPATPLVVARVIERTFEQSLPFAMGVVRETSMLGDLRRDLQRSIDRWNAARVTTLTRAAGVMPPSFLTPDEAKTFWFEASKMAIQLKVLLDQPFENPINDAWTSIKQAWHEAPTLTGKAIENTAAFGAEIVTRAIAGAVYGASKGALRGLGFVFGTIAVGGLAYYGWKRWRKR